MGEHLNWFGPLSLLALMGGSTVAGSLLVTVFSKQIPAPRSAYPFEILGLRAPLVRVPSGFAQLIHNLSRDPAN